MGKTKSGKTLITHYSLLITLLGLLALPAGSVQAQFDHEHGVWTALLKKHVVLIDGGKASQARYAGLAKDREQLKAYLGTLSKVSQEEFNSWSKAQQLAFLINAYDDPRIHMAVNCASIGCPMLREEAYVAARLDRQLEEQVVRFLADRSRNRFDPGRNALEVSEIFKWYAEDFTRGLKGINSREQFFARYANLLGDSPEHQKIVREQKAELRFLEYDWSLNDARR